MRNVLAFIVVLSLIPCIDALAQQPDAFQWLEDIQGDKAMAWVKEQNAMTTADLQKVPEYQPIFKRTMEIYDSKERIPYPAMIGEYLYNFWQDKEHERGIWRRTSLVSYRTAQPAWEMVIDLDAMSKADGVTWTWGGTSCLAPEFRRCMIALSRGGSDAAVQREFDLVSKTFVEGGFSLSEAKSNVSWRDIDTLWVGTDFGEGSLTSSGYPRLVKLWRRGTPLDQAKTVFAGEKDDVASGGGTVFRPDGRYDLVTRGKTFYTNELYLLLDGRLVRIDIPEDASFQGFFRDHMLIQLRSDWKLGPMTYPQGALLAAKVDDLLQGVRNFAVLFEPSAKESLETVATIRDVILFTTLNNVRSKFYSSSYVDGKWVRKEIGLPGLGSVGIAAGSDDFNTFFSTYQDMLTPSSLFLVENGKTEKVKSMPAFFNSTGMQVEQYEVASKDGVKIPYFVVTPKGFVANGKAPTLLYGYGGFEVSMTPSYSTVRGSAWLERGGVYVLANIRGGGEFGPGWHNAAIRQNHIKSFEDFVAIAEDLVARKITSPQHLGIMGGSNGGLLVGAAFVLRPDLFNAVVCQVPLLDMKRYHKLLAGASWIAEYGDPDKPEDWAYIKTWSPYQNVKKDVRYPKVFFWTTTRDDRVHPGHPRKMVAKMQSLGHPVYYFENTEGGHGTGAVNRQRAMVTAMEYAYLWKMLR